MSFVCSDCNRSYKYKSGLKKHIEKCKKATNVKPTNVKPKKARISGYIRKQVWETYVGQYLTTKCFCCYKSEITPFSNCNTFHAGHIISDKNGGEVVIDNLLPICRDCNLNMGANNWDEYVEKNNFRLRRCGANAPIKKYMKGIIWCQSLVRMWLERKNQHSMWRIEYKKRTS